MSEDALNAAKRRKIDEDGDGDEEVVEDVMEEEPAALQPESQSGPLEPYEEESEKGAESAKGSPLKKEEKRQVEDEMVDVCGDGEDEHDIPLLDDSMRTPTKKRPFPGQNYASEDVSSTEPERINSSFPCQVIPETLGRMTRTPPDGEDLLVFKNKNGRLRVFVENLKGRYSCYSTLTHKLCTVCSRRMEYGEMHLNFPADLDRRRIWANLLGFKYKDILRSKLGPVALSISAGPICTEHFAEECFRNHNFNKAAIEAFGVPVAISPDVKTTPSKKRVPWVCTICDFHSCSVVELQTHLLDHTEEMLKQKDNAVEVPEAGFMCPFCRKCTYGYKTISGYRRHLASGPIHHCHLRRIYEFAKMNCRATELDPMDSWDNWTRRNVYVAYHGCEPPANEIVLTPSPTKKVYPQNPEERTKMVHDAEKRKKAVRSLSFVGKEGGTSVNDHNVMQRQVYLQIRREMVHAKKAGGPGAGGEDVEAALGQTDTQEEIEHLEREEMEQEEPVDEMAEEEPTPQVEKKKDNKSSTSKKATPTTVSSESATSSPVKKSSSSDAPTKSEVVSAPPTPIKKRKVAPAADEPPAAPPRAPESAPAPAPEELDEEARLRKQKFDERFSAMVAKRASQVKNLINAKKFKLPEKSPQKPRKALQYTLRKGITFSSASTSEVVREESPEPPTPREESPEPTNAPSTSTKKTSSAASASSPAAQNAPTPSTRVTRSQKSGSGTSTPSANAPKTTTTTRSSTRKAVAAPEAAPKESAPESVTSKKGAPESSAVTTTSPPEERPLKSMLARSLTAGVRPSMAQYRLESFGASSGATATSSGAPTSGVISSGAPGARISTGAGTSKSISTGAIQIPRAGSSSPGGLFSQRVMGAIAQQEKGAIVGAGAQGAVGVQAPLGAGGQGAGPAAKRPAVLARRPIILSPRKRGAAAGGSTTPRPIAHHESSPVISSTTSVPMGIPLTTSKNSTTSSSSSTNNFNLEEKVLISAKDMEVGMIEEVVDSVAAGHSTTSDDVLIPSGALGAAIAATPNLGASIPVTYGTLTLAEALELDSGASSSLVKDHEFEDISKKMGDGSLYCRAMEDVIKSRTVTKMRADMRLSRHCIRQIEAAKARARLFGEGTEDYQIYYSTDGAQVLSKNDPKWRELQQQNQLSQQQQSGGQQPGPSDQL